jgi:hypothetical protein
MIDREAIIKQLEAKAEKMPGGSEEWLRVLRRIEDHKGALLIRRHRSKPKATESRHTEHEG